MEIRFTNRELFVKCTLCLHGDTDTGEVIPDGNYVFRWHKKPGANLDSDLLVDAMERHLQSVHPSYVPTR